MPHLVFTSPLSLETIAEQFAAFNHTDSDIHVGYSAVYRGKHNLLFEVHVNEPTINQHTALLLTERFGADKHFTLQMGSFGHPRPTPGMHVAVSALGEWLLSLHPGAQVVIQKVRQS